MLSVRCLVVIHVASRVVSFVIIKWEVKTASHRSGSVLIIAIFALLASWRWPVVWTLFCVLVLRRVLLWRLAFMLLVIPAGYARCLLVASRPGLVLVLLINCRCRERIQAVVTTCCMIVLTLVYTIFVLVAGWRWPVGW